MAWADVDHVSTHLGIPTDERMVQCLGASLAFCHRARHDLAPDTPVKADIQLAVVLYAALLYRERTTPMGFATYEELDTSVGDIGGAMTNIYRLLGTRRPVAL